MPDKITRIDHIKPGSLCLDNNRLCVLVKIGEPEDSPATRLMNQARILQPYGWFLDLDLPHIRWTTDVPPNHSGDWVASLFTRNLDVVEWLNLGTVEEVTENGK